AQTWDSDITLATGGYRSAKPIQLTGDFAITLEAGAWLDGIEFTSIDKGQHWKITGSFLRTGKISTQLGGSLEATDSVFENTIMWKTGGWFTQWFGTKWRFQNCILAKAFMPVPLKVGDYTVCAKDSTFIGIKLPSFDIVKNYDYFQGDNQLRFENCRFVQCAVPETFLAATVNCVFEQCTFPGPRSKWPKETPPINVSAFTTGASAPKSYTHGPLVVTFAPAAPDAKYGSTIPFTISGTHVVAASLPEPKTFLQIGTLRTKKSSDLAP
ncbi:MAG: hypothetical protein ACREKL_07055, partial [Chthoniobacterales bacterium]